jgi:endoglycosylceramidase
MSGRAPLSCDAPRMRCSFALILFVAACSSPPYKPQFGPVDSDGSILRDARGRALILRGVNARVAGVFDVTFDDGRDPREIIPGFGADDVAALRAAGFTLLRLPINWSAVEPSPGQYSDAYLDRVATVVELLRNSGVLVVIDFHEDGFSKELCEDGAPLWAIRPPLTTLVGGPGPLAMQPDCHASADALMAFQAFFDDVDMLQEKYAAMVQHVAQRFAGDAQVLGYEIMNEPIGDNDLINAFDVKVASAIRAVDKKHLVLFEPSATRNIVNFAPRPTLPFSVPGAVYSVHIYTGVFNNSGAIADGSYPPLVANSIAGARDEADGWKTPLVITEYGINADNPKAKEYVGHLLDDADAQLASTTMWLWKEQSQGEWGLYTHNADGSWSPRPVMFDAISRPYAQAIGGNPTALTWDGTTLTIAFNGRADVPSEHDIFWNRGAPTIRCDGATTTAKSSDSVSSRFTVACGSGHGAHTLTFQ